MEYAARYRALAYQRQTLKQNHGFTISRRSIQVDDDDDDQLNIQPITRDQHQQLQRCDKLWM
jgi:hypothetical protein